MHPPKETYSNTKLNEPESNSVNTVTINVCICMYIGKQLLIR